MGRKDFMAIQGIAILGSTGSIGRQTLEVARQLSIPVEALAGHNNIELLAEQIQEFEPRLAVAATAQKALELKKLLQKAGGWLPEIAYGPAGYEIAATMGKAQTIVCAMVGIAGLAPVLAAVKAGKRIALANKETLVAGGSLVTKMAHVHGSVLIPVDSEHSAIFQCLDGRTISYAGWSKGAKARDAYAIQDSIKRIILTASGGPFRGWSQKDLAKVTAQQALQHPNWSMGPKVTIDSATLMNKGLEVIEAYWLFNVAMEKIQPVIHPQSIIHSMVEFMDGSVLTQMGTPDMRLPIQVALTWPKRQGNDFPSLDFMNLAPLTFEAPDRQAFPCLDLAYAALRAGGTMPAVMNGANEAAVSDFLAGKIGFLDIPRRIAEAMDRHKLISKPVLEDILAADKEGRGLPIE